MYSFSQLMARCPFGLFRGDEMPYLYLTVSKMLGPTSNFSFSVAFQVKQRPEHAEVRRHDGDYNQIMPSCVFS